MAKRNKIGFVVATGASLRQFGACANYRKQTVQDLMIKTIVKSAVKPARDSKGRFIKVVTF